jgi:toxin ParE1/3/4
MIFEIEISNQTDNDLRNIYKYTAFELQSPDNASGQLDRLEKGIMVVEILKISLTNIRINKTI